MRSKLKVYLAVIFLITTAAYGDESIAPFAKKFLNFDLSTFPLQRLEFPAAANGEGFDTNNVVGLTEPLDSQFLSLKDKNEILWVTNNVSAKYMSDFPNRRLVFGFRNGSVAAIQIRISAFLLGDHTVASGVVTENLREKEIKQRRADLAHIQNELFKIGNGKSFNFHDDRWNVQNTALCSPRPEDIVISTFQITPLEKSNK